MFMVSSARRVTAGAESVVAFAGLFMTSPVKLVHSQCRLTQAHWPVLSVWWLAITGVCTFRRMRKPAPENAFCFSPFYVLMRWNR
ncbi:hypothetical protein KCP76_12835 [Salmonella enterica subsp. enterica serovar Weltevreden]|nr:hypothetical protein KCP76_12835 [Salmonella enterica subsp. enterica serovar Weltevreden]